jgi:hypothetical protein
MGDGDRAQELGELLDALTHVHGDPDPDRADRARRQRNGHGPKFEALASRGGSGRPVACTLQTASQLLGVPVAQVRKAAGQVPPHLHANGSPRWSLNELERALGQRPRRGAGSGAGSAWRGRSIQHG